MRRTVSEVIRGLEGRIARLEKSSGAQKAILAQNIKDEINDYIEDVWGMDSEWCYNKIISVKGGFDKGLYILIEVGCEDAGVDAEYMIVSQRYNRQVLVEKEILSLREAQREFKSVR